MVLAKNEIAPACYKCLPDLSEYYKGKHTFINIDTLENIYENIRYTLESYLKEFETEKTYMHHISQHKTCSTESRLVRDLRDIKLGLLGTINEFFSRMEVDMLHAVKANEEGRLSDPQFLSLDGDVEKAFSEVKRDLAFLRTDQYLEVIQKYYNGGLWPMLENTKKTFKLFKDGLKAPDLKWAKGEHLNGELWKLLEDHINLSGKHGSDAEHAHAGGKPAKISDRNLLNVVNNSLLNAVNQSVHMERPTDGHGGSKPHGGHAERIVASHSHGGGERGWTQRPEPTKVTDFEGMRNSIGNFRESSRKPTSKPIVLLERDFTKTSNLNPSQGQSRGTKPAVSVIEQVFDNKKKCGEYIMG